LKERFVDLLYLFNPSKAESMLEEMIVLRSNNALENSTELSIANEILACVKLFSGFPHVAIELCDRIIALRNDVNKSAKTMVCFVCCFVLFLS
jgi:hypothetical protein